MPTALELLRTENRNGTEEGIAAAPRRSAMTIKDISRETGYSVGTVSRVLNGQPNVSEKARATILSCAEKRGFQLNANAKRLKQQRSDGILAVVTGTSNELFARLIEQIQRILAQTSYSLTVDYVEENEDPVLYALRVCREKKPEGILFLGGDARFYARSFGQISLPAVLLTNDASGLGFSNLSSVTTDDEAAAERAIDYLVSCGHREIGIISGELGASGEQNISGPSLLRFEGCRRAFARHGLRDPETCCETARFSFGDGYIAAKRLLARKDFTAIFAMADVMAIGAIRALAESGLRVPEDVSVIGFDGLELGEYYIPKLTTIRQHASLLARRGVALLLDAIENQAEARHETVPFVLAEHASVKNFRED